MLLAEYQIRIEFTTFMRKSCDSSVLFGSGSYGAKSYTLTASSGRQILTVLHVNLSGEGIGGYDAYLGAGLSTKFKLDKPLAGRNLLAGKNGIFKNVSDYTAYFIDRVMESWKHNRYSSQAEISVEFESMV